MAASTSRSQQFPILGDQVVDRLRRILTFEVRRACPSSLASYREDMVQAALIRVVRLSDEEGVRVFTVPYLRKVAASVAVDELRRHRRRCEENLDFETLIALRQDWPGPEDHAIAQQMSLAIRKGLSLLGTARRAAVCLHLQGHSVPEAARSLGWSKKRVANLTYRGLRDLRRLLTAQGFAGSVT